MMDAMMRGRVKDIFEPAKPADETRVYPELINQIQPVHQCKHPRCKTKQHYWSIKYPMRDAAEPALPTGNTQIKLLARVVNYVKVPQYSRLMTDPVKPVIDKIIYEKQHHPRPPGRRRKMKRGVFIQKKIDQSGRESENITEPDAAKSESNVGRGIQRISKLVRDPEPGNMRLYRDQGREKRNYYNGWR